MAVLVVSMMMSSLHLVIESSNDPDKLQSSANAMDLLISEYMWATVNVESPVSINGVVQNVGVIEICLRSPATLLTSVNHCAITACIVICRR